MTKNEQDGGDGERLLTPDQAAETLKVSKPTLARWRCTGFGPPFIKLGDRPQSPVRYRLSDVNDFIKNGVRVSTCDPGPGATR